MAQVYVWPPDERLRFLVLHNVWTPWITCDSWFDSHGILVAPYVGSVKGSWTLGGHTVCELLLALRRCGLGGALRLFVLASLVLKVVAGFYWSCVVVRFGRVMNASLGGLRFSRAKAFGVSALLSSVVGSAGMLAFGGGTSAAQSNYQQSSVKEPKSVTFTQQNRPPIVYRKPPSSLIPEGRTLFTENCSTCHGVDAAGSSRAPNLQGLGAATIDFWVYTGRMPLADPTVQAIQKPRKFSRQQTLAIAAYVSSLAPGGPGIPSVNVAGANISQGESLFSTNCAACHTITGVGDALANNVYAPSLYGVGATQIAEAMRTGPGNMPRFGNGTLSNAQVADVVKYVLYLQKPQDPGGLSLGHVGPVTEGFVGILIGLGGLMLFGYWVGGRASR